jgi:GT2 family glycosyltransferase
LSYDYIGRLALFRKDLAVRVGGYRAEYAEAQDYDLLLRASENTRSIVHVPKVLYHRLADGRRRARGPYEAEKRAVEDALRRRMSEASVLEDNGTGVRRIRYKIAGTPKVAIIIPTRDNASILKVCIQSVIRRTRYENYEIVIVDNQSAEEETLQYYRRLESQHPNVRILHYDKPFNYSAINNFAVSRISADYVLFLNNDTEVIGGGWLTPMLELAQRDDVGVVGAKLCYRNNTIQHGGVILGVDGIAGHSHKRYSRSSRGYMERLVCVQNLSAVTGACMMIRKRLFEELGGFDEAIAISYNDVDLCLRVREKGLLVIFTPYAALYHHEGRSLGDETVERQTRLGIERALMLRKWRQTLGRGDPYYSPNLTHGSEDFGIRI